MTDRVRKGTRERRPEAVRGLSWLTPGLWLALLVIAPLAAYAGGAGALMAQERGDTASCRCVDRDGNEIENCRCMRMFSAEPLQGLMGSFTTRRAVIGVWIDAGQGEDADRRGATIDRVQDDGPAARAGLQPGDVVVAVGGRSVFDPLENGAAERALDLDESIPVQRFRRLIAALEPDEPVELEVLRDGSRRTVTVTPERGTGVLQMEGLRDGLASMRLRSIDTLRHFLVDSLRHNLGELRWRVFPDSLVRGTLDAARFGFRTDPCFGFRQGAAGQVWALGAGNCVDGVEFVELNPELGAYFGTERGVLVAEVAEESSLGLRPGDVLMAVDGREVTDAQQARRILMSYGEDEEMRLRVRRQDREMEVLGRRR